MNDKNDNNAPHEIGGILSRINLFGAATERLFSRLYNGLSNRARIESEREARQRRREELQAKIDQARQIADYNYRLKTALQQREQDLERLNGILSALNEGIIMQDTEGRIVYINTAARELLGSQKNFWETDLGMLFNQHRDVTHVDSEIAPLGEPSRIQVNNRVLGAQLAAVANEAGERLGTMIVLRDVTRDALADRLKDQFVTAISHELKTPMTVIKGMSEVLKNQPEDKPPNRRLLETLSRNVDVLDRMVVELLDVSEMGAGTFEIREDRIALEPLLWTVINGATPEITKNRLDVMVMVRNAEKIYTVGDQERLRWALGHLLQNSISYTEPGGHIWLEVGLDEESTDYLRIDFIDSGVGISEKDQPHIFERFYRGDPRNAAGRLVDPRGLGQGLFIARTVAEAHGGYLGLLRSRVGEGSIFTVVLPVAHN
ncbi:MAG: sensor histidine kinase [Chloroflexota bacterium]